MNWLNLCSGGEIGRQAVKELGLPVDRWYSSEIDKFAIKVAKDNHDDVIHIGDIRGVLDNIVSLKSIDVILCGSPCQGFSVAGKGLNFEHPQSKLFFEFLHIYRTIYQANPNVKLLFENVRMKKQWQDMIFDMLTEINPKLKLYIINSSVVSAQNRVRMYITDFEFDMPEDKGIKLKDIIECGCVDREKSYCLDANYWKGGNLRTYFEKSRRQLVFKNHNIEKSDTNCIQVGVADLNGHDILNRVYSVEGKSPTLNTGGGGNREPKILCGAFRGRYKVDGVRQDHKHSVAGMTTQQLEMRLDAKTNTLTTVQKDNVAVNLDELKWRKLTVRECERLQTLPDDYTEWGIFEDPKLPPSFWSRKKISNTQRYKMIGNGFTTDVIAHILGGIPNDIQE